MTSNLTVFPVPEESIESKILLIRGQKVMLDRDLAQLYGVETKVLNQSVRRNRKRFPHDFMFVLTLSEAQSLRSQFVTSNVGRGGIRYESVAFTEQGIAMLSSVLNSERAILVNIQIIRTFTKLRDMIAHNDELRHKLEALEKRYDEQFKIVFDAIRRIMTVEEDQTTEIGFKSEITSDNANE